MTSFESGYSEGFPDWLAGTGGSLVVTTYQAGHVILIHSDGRQLYTDFVRFDRPMGTAFFNNGLYVASRLAIWEFRHHPDAAATLNGRQGHDRHPIDGCFLPRQTRWTGDVQTHDVFPLIPSEVDDTAIGSDFGRHDIGLVASRLSCIAAIDRHHGLRKIWQPSWITEIDATDRCHLNGAATHDGKLRIATALAKCDVAEGWRANRTRSGVIVDIAAGATIATELSMPHSPVVNDGALWFLESGRGRLRKISLDADDMVEVADLAGFARGLAIHNGFAVIGLSRIRDTNNFGDLPIARTPVDSRMCGVAVVDTSRGALLHQLQFTGSVEEIYDVNWLPWTHPALVVADHDGLIADHLFFGD